MTWKQRYRWHIILLALFCSLFAKGSTFLWDRKTAAAPLFFHDETLSVFFEREKIYISSISTSKLQEMNYTYLNAGFLIKELDLQGHDALLCHSVLSQSEGFLKITAPAQPIDRFFQCDAKLISSGGEGVVYHFYFNRTFKSWAVEGNVPPPIRKTVKAILRIFHETHYTDHLGQTLHRLRILNLSDQGVVSLAPLGSFLSLRIVRLSGNPIENLDPLLTIRSLQIVALDTECGHVPKASTLFPATQWRFIERSGPYSIGKPACFIMNKAFVEGQKPSLTL